MNENSNEQDLKLKNTVANMFVMFSIVRGTLNNLGFISNIDSSQLSGICFNKILQTIQKK